MYQLEIFAFAESNSGDLSSTLLDKSGSLIAIQILIATGSASLLP